MAKDSEPRARPITVSELSARSESSGSAFPKSASDEDRRTLRRAGASGMPSHPPVPPEDDPDEVGPEANVVTGIIPVVSDEPADATESLEPVAGDDMVGVDLPPVEYRFASAPTSAAAAPHPDSDVTVTDALALVDDYDDEDDYQYDDAADDAREVDEPVTEHRHIASAAELEAAQEAEDAAEAEADEQARAAEKKSKKRKRDEETEPRETSPLLGWLGLIAEVVLGLAVGAGLFWGFTELWKRYVYLALILAVVVIFAIVTFAHVLRKRDLPTTLMALGVGMLVTIGPLVLLAA